MVRITGAKAHAARLKRMTSPEARRQIGAALYAGGQLIEQSAALSITEGSAGGKSHIPSKPGEPPNADTGQLDRSITTERVEELVVQVQADAPHAIALEFGTSKMAERPFMRPAVSKERNNAVELVRKAVKKIAAGGRVVP